MARPKQIEDSVLLELIKKYFDEECNYNVKKLKASEITKYINTHGYPDYQASTLRRTPAATDYIESLKKLTGEKHYVTVVAYQTVDAAALVETNRSKDKLIRAITERDLYYKEVADSAAYHFEKYGKLQKEYEVQKGENLFLTNRVTELEGQVFNCKSEIKQLKADLKARNTVIDTYIYPEIANTLLEKEGAVRKTDNYLKDDILENNIIYANTDIGAFSKSGSSVISGLFDI